MMALFLRLFLCTASILCCFSFQMQPNKPLKTSLQASRRSILQKAFVLPLVNLSPSPAQASGGATAGGAYLLSAKQRYNDRVKTGARNFLAIGAALDAQDIVAIRYLFQTDEAGSWSDFSSAGYLLANAFRRNSSAAPDSLPSVKKWKAFAARVDGMTKALKKKDFTAGKKAYEDALLALDEYLEQVDLPPAAQLQS